MDTFTRINRIMMLLCCFSLVVQGCSTIQAVSGPKYRDLSILKVGVHRHVVLAEFEQPVATETEQDGTKVDIFSFRQGLPPAVKGGKSFLYGAAAVGTFGFSEIIASPLEGSIGNKGAEMQLKVGYDKDNLIDEVVILKDDRWVPIEALENKKKITN